MKVQQQIEEQLTALLTPEFLDVRNESHLHSVPPDSETHFRVVAVASAFEGQRKVARHQRIYTALAAQLEGPVHALALHVYTPGEWAQRQEDAPASPDCLGGSKADRG
jgi:BolA protein